MNLLRLTRLRHFCAVAERGSIGLAARLLHITQPALTRSIRKIEADVGERVFERTTQGVRLTAAGRALLPYVQAILAEADRAVQEYGNLKGERRTRLKVGISANFGLYVLPDALERYFAEYPESHVEVLTGTIEQLVGQLLSTQIDLALAVSWQGTIDTIVGRSVDLGYERLLSLPAGPYAPAGHPLAGRKGLSIRELQAEKWVVPHGLSISYVFQGRFSAQGYDPPVQLLSTASLDLLLSSSLRLGAVTIVPRHLVAAQVEAGEMVPLDCPDLALDYDVVLVTRRRGSRTPAMSHFVQVLRAVCVDLRQEVRTGAARRVARARRAGTRRADPRGNQA